MSAAITYSETRDLPRAGILDLYRANAWSSADRPDALCMALAGSHALVTAWDGAQLVGLGNALSDGHLVVYYPHLLVLPTYQGRGIGHHIMHRLTSKYGGFHQHMLVADAGTGAFYRKCGFERAGATQAMWIYAGGDVTSSKPGPQGA